MAAQFYFVQATEQAVWRNHRQMIVALTRGKWNVDGAGIDVVEGVVYSFQRDEDAAYFLGAHVGEYGVEDGPPRAMPVFVEPGMIVTFWSHADAAWFVEQRKARWVSQDEVEEVVRQRVEQMSDAAGGQTDMPDQDSARPDQDHDHEDEGDAKPAAAARKRRKGAA